MSGDTREKESRRPRLPGLVAGSVLLVLLVASVIHVGLIYEGLRRELVKQIQADNDVIAGAILEVITDLQPETGDRDEYLPLLQQICNQLRLPNGGFVCVADHSGDLLAGPSAMLTEGKEFAGTVFVVDGESLDFEALPPGTVRAVVERSGEEEIVAAVPMGMDGDRILVHQSLAIVRERAMESAMRVAPFSLIVAVTVSIAVFLVSKTIVGRYEARIGAAEDRLRATNRDLEQSNARRRNLIHLLSHDIRNSVSAIGAAVSPAPSASAGPAGTPTSAVLSDGDIHESIDETLRMLDIVRAGEAIESGKTRLDLQPVSLTESLERALHVIEPRRSQKGVRIETDVADDLAVVAEPTSLANSVLTNVLSNAVKFSRSGSVIRVEASETDGNVLVAVTDRGVGIPPDLVDRLFDAKSATTRPGTDGETGTGFGMPLVRNFVEAYGGSVSVTSTDRGEDSGTTVAISLPSAFDKDLEQVADS